MQIEFTDHYDSALRHHTVAREGPDWDTPLLHARSGVVHAIGVGGNKEGRNSYFH